MRSSEPNLTALRLLPVLKDFPRIPAPFAPGNLVIAICLAKRITEGPRWLLIGLVGLLDELELDRVSLCGLSLGGATAMWVAAEAPERIDRLILACTSVRFGEPAQWLERAETVRSAGLEAIADKVVARWFTADVRPETVAAFRRLLVSTPPEGYAGSCEALAGWDFRGRLGEIRADTLVIAGAEDVVAPLRESELLVERIATLRA